MVSEPTPVREAVVPEPQNGGVALTISPDGMEVKASLIPPLYGGRPVTLDEVHAELAAAKVIFGIDQTAVAELVRAAEEGSRIDPAGLVIARGRRPVRGQDGAILHHPLLETPAGYPKLREDGTADFFDLSVVRNVEAEVVLGTRRPPTRGEHGCDVYGRTVPAQDGRDVKLRAGKGTKLAPDGQSVLSTIEGHAAISQGGEVTVSAIYAVLGDVDYGTGNIDFVGTVIIRGDIGFGFSVKAGQNVEVHGGIMGGSVEAGGNVTVRYGIVGGGRGRVVAGGKVQCRFIEGAEVSAGGGVTVVDGILNAQVSAGESVTVTGPRGSIIGGLVRARREVNVRTLGSPRGVATEIQVGVAPEVRTELARIQETLAQVENRFGRSTQAAAYLGTLQQRSPSSLTPVHRQSLHQATREQRLSAAEREQLVSRAAALQASFEEAKYGRVRSYDTAYPGVRILIGSARYLVVDLSPNICFFLGEDGEVAIVSN